MEKKIIYLPLDERPCNYVFPQYIAQIGGAQLCLPPMALMGRYKTPADTEALWQWLLENAEGAAAAVVSVDMLVYGGIVPSRLHHLTRAQCGERLARLKTLRQRLPAMQLYAFSLITRAPARNGSGEEPDYYEAHGYDIWHYGLICDREQVGLATPDELAEKAAILSRVPKADLDDFAARRAVNFENNVQCLGYAAEGVFDHYAIPLDDCAEHGYAPAERRRLAETAAGLGILSKISMYPGADEMGCTLTARALCHMHGLRPLVWPVFSSNTGQLTVPPYEDRTIGETLPHHVRCAGGHMAATPVDAAIHLMVNPPTAFSNRIKFELDRRMLYMEPERNLPAFMDAIEDALEQGKTCVVADCAVPDGADECLMRFLAEQKLFGRVDGFSGWNTSSNAMGTAVAHGVAIACAKAAGGFAGAALAASRRFLLMRYVEDWGYMTHVRQDVQDEIDAGAFGPDVTARNLGGAAGMQGTIEQEVTRRLRAFAEKYLADFADAGAEETVPTATLPWNRMFEIDLVMAAPEETA